MFKKIFFYSAILSCLIVSPVMTQQVFINEIMSSNGRTIPDEDNDYPDWIELFNNQQSAVDLTDYKLSDDSSNLNKWIFPQISIFPYEHILVFASDKNRTEYIKHWETVINWGDIWKYRINTNEAPANWRNIGFDDSGWLSGPSGFGFGDGDDSTLIPANTPSVYVRKIFTIQDVNDVNAVYLHVDFDDAFVAYLNGVEIARENIGTVGIPPTWSQSATAFTEPKIVYGGKPNAYIIQNFRSLLQPGNNVIAIQVHNYGTGSSDLTLIPFLTIGYKIIPDNPHGANPLLDLPNKFLHTNFKLSSEGESIFLTNSQGVVVDQKQFGNIGPDISLGRKPDGNDQWLLFNQPTPGDSNLTEGFTGLVSEPIISTNGGFFSAPQLITITAASVGDTIRYTLDGSVPDYTSQIYSEPILISSTSVLRARAFNLGAMPSKILTNTYFINFSTALTVVSLSTNPGNFFDEEYGIYTMGDSAEANYPYFGANFWKDWERPVHVELFETNGTKGFDIDMGVKIFGNWSRGNAQKSLALFARGEYGYGSLNYKLFDNLPFIEYQSFILRNAGNDWLSTMMRDGFITSLVDDIDLDKQAYRPAIVFINGAYWGIHNIREKINEAFLSQHHNVNPDSVNILENFGELGIGNNEEYFELYNFIAANSMNNPTNYEFVKSRMDIDNFIRYQVTEIYIDNQDWPGNNIKFWKPKTGGKWRWILYDTDFGFGIWDQTAYQNNTLNFATATNGPEWPNPPWSTLMLRQLLNNYTFKYDFINCFADLSNTIFAPAAVVNKINSISSAITSEMPRHIAKWQQFTYNTWLSNIQSMRYFASQRLNYMRTHFIQKFGLTGISTVNLTISDTSMGMVKLNSIDIKNPNWSGTYFMGVPIKLIAKPKRGYKFVQWQGSSGLTKDTLDITPQGNLTLTALFQVDSSYTDPKVIINEINYNSSSTFNTEDWVELYNNSGEDIEISGWVFKDSDDSHSFVIPQNNVIKKDSFIVICIDTTLFKALFPDVKNRIGNTGFGLSGSGELIRLYDNAMNLIDSLTYSDKAPWPTQPDGNGATLSLKNPNLDNSLASSWAASVGHGTPGKINDVYTPVDDKVALPPEKFTLEQNYPNPFNPATKIRYSVSATSLIRLKIFDVLGKEIETLVNEVQNQGYYEINFNGDKLSSGVYFYQLETNGFTSTKKMILLR